MKRSSFIALLFLCINLSFVSAQTKIHMALFCDTNDEKIGESALTDVRIYQHLMGDIANALKSQNVLADSKTFVGNDCSPQNARNYINNLSCKNDIVLFLYSGHGGRSHDDDKESNFPRMCFGSNSDLVKVTEVINTLKSRQPRLIVIVADCCNSYYDRRSASTESFERMDAGNGDGLRKLFLNYSGVICVTAASPGEYGWCTSAGGYLTVNLNNVLYRALGSSENISWESVLKETQRKTYEMTINHGTPKTQTPYYEIQALGTNNCDNGSNNPDINNNNSGDNTNGNSQTDNSNGYSDNYVNNNTNGNSNQHNIGQKRGGFSEALIHSFPIVLIGFLLGFKLPQWLNFSDKVVKICRIAGVLIIIKGIIDFFMYL